MCYFNSINLHVGDIIKIGNKEKKNQKEIQSNITSGFEFTQWPILKKDAMSDELIVEMAHWEFIPSWINTEKDLQQSREKFTTLNAKGENVLESRMYKDAALHRRCLVLSSGFYEWRHFKAMGAKKENAYPYFIHLKNSSHFFMAGIYQPWTNKETGETIETFAIITTAANDLMAKVHNKKKRMPCILNEQLASKWLDEKLSEKEIITITNYQIDSNLLEAYTIKKDFKSSFQPQEQFKYPELPGLSQSEGFSNELPFV
jgi:putative SOS response-associated peptidase YedK